MAELVAGGTGPRDLIAFQRAFTAYIRDPQSASAPPGVPPDRMELYAQLVFGNVERVMGNMFPVLKSLLPECQWLALARQFFRDHDMHDPLFQSMPREFLRFLEQRAPAQEDPPYLLELAHWEWVDYALSIDVTEMDLAGVERHGDLLAGRPVLNPLVWMSSYTFPVHRFREEAPPRAAPSVPTYLLAYRDPEDRNAYLELNPLSARLLELIDGGEHGCGASLLQALAKETATCCDEAWMAAGRAMLEGYLQRGILLGVERSGATLAHAITAPCTNT